MLWKKNLLNESPETEVTVMYSDFADIVLNKALIDFQKEQLRKEIDRSLQNRNKEEFLRLTEELNSIS